MTSPDPTSPEYEHAVAARWGPRDPTIRSFWQNAVVLSEINRRVTGNADLTPQEYFVRAYCQPPRKRGLSIGCGDAGLELTMLRLGACERMVAIDLSAARLERARAATPPELTDRLELVCANVEKWRPDGRFDVVIANGVIHHLGKLKAFFDLLDDVLTDDGLLYLDEFVGPSRFQWTDKQLEIVNRLLDRLSPALRRDLVMPELGPRPRFTRPPLQGIIAADPSEAARSAEIPAVLHRRLETVEEREWGGAIFHQLFNRIMGNFAGQDDLVRVIMELDAILTEERVVGNDYLWGIYRRRQQGRPTAHVAAELKGRVESIEGRVVVGWAASSAEPGRRFGIDAYIDHKPVAKAVADLPRSDLLREGIGDGAHAFRLELPSWICDGGHHSISIVAPSAGSTIPAARGWEQRNRSAPDGTVFSSARHAHGLELPASRVLDGREGWAFPCDDGVGSLAQLLGRLTLTEPDLACYRELLRRRSQLLAEREIPYIVGIAPAKAAVHPERLPAGTPALAPPKLARQLLELMAGTNVTTVDLYSPLRAAAIAGGQLYYKRGAHWNYQGALIAAQALLDAARKAGVAAAELSADGIQWVQESFEGDLAGRPSVVLDEGRFRPGPPASGAEVAVAPDEPSLGIQRSAASSLVCAYDPGATIVESLEHAAGPSALVLADPDGGRLQPFVGAAFSRSIWMAGWELDPALLGAERPAVVLHVLDESKLVHVPYSVAG